MTTEVYDELEAISQNAGHRSAGDASVAIQRINEQQGQENSLGFPVLQEYNIENQGYAFEIIYEIEPGAGAGERSIERFSYYTGTAAGGAFYDIEMFDIIESIWEAASKAEPGHMESRRFAG